MEAERTQRRLEPEDFQQDEQEEMDLVRNNLPDAKGAHDEISDAKLLRANDATNLTAHNDKYTELLGTYVENFRLVSEAKRSNKESLFKVAKAILIWIPIVTFVVIILSLVLVAAGAMTAVEAIPGLATALGTVVGTFLLIPQMITGYLFNEKEEEHLQTIISKIQEYDRDIRGGL